MSKVTECARALGKAIVESEEFKTMQITEKEAMSDPAVAETMSRYLEVKDQLTALMSGENPDPDRIAQYGSEMDDLQQTLNAMPAVDAMTTSRQRFSELMNQVNKVLEFIITGETAQEGGCSGNCSGCAGCH